MTWADEVEAARLDVFSELTDEEREWVYDLPVVAAHGDGSATGEPAWGRWFSGPIWRIEVYEDSFDQMEDPENRQRQLRDVIRHEYHHGLGERHPDGRVMGTTMSDAHASYLTLDESYIRTKDGLTIILPEVLP